MFASGLKETVVWLSNALSAFAISENLFICWRVRFLRPQDDQWGMFGKRRNTLISASLGSTATTVTHRPFSPKIRHMHPINSCQPLWIWCTWRHPTVNPAQSSSRAWISSSWNWKQLKPYEGYEKKKSFKRECTWTTTDNHKQSDYWNHFWKPHPSFKLVSFRGRAL